MTLSVRFYKRLILVIIALLIVVPTVLSISLWNQNAALKKDLAQAGTLSGTVPGGEPGEPLPLVGEEIDYQALYPELYSSAAIPAQRKTPTGTVYLTFDCSPGENTRQILDALDDSGVKAAFFVTVGGEESSQAILKEIADRGHTIGLRSYSDSYQTVYESVSAYLEDFKKAYDYVYNATGEQVQLFRFPGGSINAYNSGIYQELIAEMLRRGFVFYDWNVSGEDSSINDAGPQHITESVKAGIAGKDWAIVALRDSYGKEAVAQALPEVIRSLQSMGYTLEPLTVDVMPVIFSYKNAP